MHYNQIAPGIVRMALDQTERSILDGLVEHMRTMLPEMTEPQFLNCICDLVSTERHQLPRIADLMREIAAHGDIKVAVIDIGEDSVGYLGPTPLDYYHKHTIQNLYLPDVYRAAIVGLAGWYAYGFTTQQNGVIHNNIIPIESHSETAGHSGSAKVDLGLHTEDASFNLGHELDLSPDFLTLHFFRNPQRVATTVAWPDWSILSSDTIDLLFEDCFTNRTNPNQGGEQNDPDAPISIIYGSSSDPWIRLNTNRIGYTTYTPEHSAALRELINNLTNNRFELLCDPGQVAIIDNRRVLHGRLPYRKNDLPLYDGADRWHRRLVASQDASRIRMYEASERLADPTKLLRQSRSARMTDRDAQA